MSAELNPDLRLEIAHVLFIDIVGYSKLLINEQRESLEELNQIKEPPEPRHDPYSPSHQQMREVHWQR